MDPSDRVPATTCDTIPSPPPCEDPEDTLENVAISCTEIALHTEELDE